MPETNDVIPVSESLPDGYEEVLHWNVTEKRSRVIALNISGVVLFVVFGLIFSGLVASLGNYIGQIRACSKSGRFSSRSC